MTRGESKEESKSKSLLEEHTITGETLNATPGRVENYRPSADSLENIGPLLIHFDQRLCEFYQKVNCWVMLIKDDKYLDWHLNKLNTL